MLFKDKEMGVLTVNAFLGVLGTGKTSMQRFSLAWGCSTTNHGLTHGLVSVCPESGLNEKYSIALEAEVLASGHPEHLRYLLPKTLVL